MRKRKEADREVVWDLLSVSMNEKRKGLVWISKPLIRQAHLSSLGNLVLFLFVIPESNEKAVLYFSNWKLNKNLFN